MLAAHTDHNYQSAIICQSVPQLAAARPMIDDCSGGGAAGPGLVRAIVMERISAAKKLSRPEIELNEWSRRGYAQSSILNTEVFNNNMCQYLLIPSQTPGHE